MSSRRQAGTDPRSTEHRRKPLRPSRKERAPYTDALAQGVAEGRLTHTLYEERLAEAEKAPSFDALDALVADLPFDPPSRPSRVVDRPAPGPRGRRFVLPVVAALVAAGAMFAIVLEGGSDPAEDTVAEAPVIEDDHPPEGWQPPAVAGGLDDVQPLQDTTLAAAVDRAREAGFTDIEQVSLSPDATTVTGMVAVSGDEDEAFRQLHLRPGDVGILSDTRGNRGAYLDPDDLDLDLDALIAEARAASDAQEDQDVRSVLVYRGDGSAERDHEEGNLVQVSFAEGPSVTLRVSDRTVLW